MDIALACIPAAGVEPAGVGALEVEPHAVGCVPVEPASFVAGCVTTPGVAPPEDEAAEPAVPDADGGGTVRSLWQYRHLIASSWISSAQYGHFFTSRLHDPSEGQAYRRGPAGMPLR
jgi:hypothetical protein